MPLELKINGKMHTVDAPSEMPLLWVLRDVLGLTGTKYGCGIGQCAACTVHVDGRAQRSCLITASDVEGASITTIEGLAEEERHPVQTAWVETDVAQCGYCQAGQIMAAAALLQKNPHPSDAEIDRAMSNNICRCGTYARIREAIHKAAAMGATAHAG